MGKKAIIIGAGIGGLATAARLLSKGYSVKIIEKNKEVGGRIGIIKENGFTFDLTASIVMMPDMYIDLLEELGLSLEFIKIEPNYRANFWEGSSIDFYTDLEPTLEQIEKIYSKDGEGYLRFLSNGYEKYNVTYDYFLSRSFCDIGDILNPSTFIGAFKAHTLTNSYEYISKFVESEKLRTFLAFQSMYIGVNPYEGSDIYTIIPAISAIKGLWYIKGGMYSYINLLEKYIRENGGEIELETECKEIIIENEKVKEIITDKWQNQGDIIICNSDFSYSMDKFIKNDEYKKDYPTKKINSMEYSCSAFILYLGLKKKYTCLKVHNIFLGVDFKENISAPFEGDIPSQPSLYLYCPSAIDKTMAPEGKEAISVIVRVPNLLKVDVKWSSATIKELRANILSILKKVKGLEDIEENIEYESYLTPVDLQERFNCYEGNGFGISHNLNQSAFLRPQIKNSDVEGLYFVGDSVHPGTGASLVLLGSKLLCDEIYNS